MKESSHPGLTETQKKREEFTIRPYRAGDEIAITEMFNEVFGQTRELSHWNWKYRDNPEGPGIISIAETAGGMPAAHFGSYPLKTLFWPVENKEYLESTIYHAGDKMSRPQFRSAGFGKNSLLARTFRYLAELPKKSDTAYTYGFMAHHSLRFGLLLLNYTLVEPAPYRRIEWPVLSGIGTGRLRKILAGIRAEEVSEVDGTWTDFFSRVGPAYKYLVKRDEAYVRWRYLRRPDRKYLILKVMRRSRLSGWSVFYREGKKIIWGDALFQKGDHESVKTCLASLRAHAISKDAEYLECWFPPRPEWWDKTLNSLGFRKETEPSKLCFCIGIIKDTDSPERVKKYLYYALGDSDLF